jgi:transposase
MDITSLGIDVGKNVFHVIGTNRAGKPLLKQKLTRQKRSDFIAGHPPCLIGMEACPGSQHLARRFEAYGHQVKLMPAQFVKPYVKSNNKISSELEVIARSRDDCRRLLTMPGVGPLVATAPVAYVGNGQQFRRGCELAAWLGLVPREHSTGGKQKLLGISKRGSSYLRKLVIHGARSCYLPC